MPPEAPGEGFRMPKSSHPGGEGSWRVEARRGSGSMMISGQRGAKGTDKESRKEKYDGIKREGERGTDGPDAIRTRDPRRVRAMS